MSDVKPLTARELAAQCWCDPETLCLEMDVRLAEAFAKRLDAKNSEIAELRKQVERLRSVCDDVVSIMKEYDRQYDETGCVSTPGGLEHMGDVWRLLSDWRDTIKSTEPKEVKS